MQKLFSSAKKGFNVIATAAADLVILHICYDVSIHALLS
jgi:hypothetical protein